MDALVDALVDAEAGSGHCWVDLGRLLHRLGCALDYPLSILGRLELDTVVFYIVALEAVVVMHICGLNIDRFSVLGLN